MDKEDLPIVLSLYTLYTKNAYMLAGVPVDIEKGRIN
jgi:hypothetical protein